MPFSGPGPFLGAQADTAYQVSRSLRFRSLASANLSRTPGTAGDRKTYTWSGWVKRGAIASASPQFLMGSGTNGTNDTSFYFTTADKIDFYTRTSSTIQGYVTTNAVFRDPSAFYHVVVVYDSANATAANRMLIYVNGVSQSLTVNNTLPQDTNGFINATVGQYIGTAQIANYFDGYLAEVNFIDGQALTPSSFGAYDTNGVWQPKACTVSDYGKNGFYLPFSDSANIFNDKAAIATNHSAANNWTPSANINTTSSGVTYDWMIDSPTNYADGGNGRGNYAVINPLSNPNGPIYTISNGNLNYSCSASAGNAPKMAVLSSIAMSSGKFYCEAIETSTNSVFGINSGLVSGGTANGPQYAAVYNGGAIASAATYSGTTSTFTTNDIIGLAFDAGALTLQIFKNGTSLGTFSGIEASVSNWFFKQSVGTGASATSSVWNFGQQPFRGMYVSGSGSSYVGTGAPPSGFSALNTQNLPAPALTPSP